MMPLFMHNKSPKSVFPIDLFTSDLKFVQVRLVAQQSKSQNYLIIKKGLEKELSHSQSGTCCFFSQPNLIVNWPGLFHTKAQEMNSFFHINSTLFSSLPHLAQLSSTIHTCSASTLAPTWSSSAHHHTVHLVLGAPLSRHLAVSLCVFHKTSLLSSLSAAQADSCFASSHFYSKPLLAALHPSTTLRLRWVRPSPSVLTLSN